MARPPVESSSCSRGQFGDGSVETPPLLRIRGRDDYEGWLDEEQLICQLNSHASDYLEASLPLASIGQILERSQDKERSARLELELRP